MNSPVLLGELLGDLGDGRRLAVLHQDHERVHALRLEHAENAHLLLLADLTEGAGDAEGVFVVTPCSKYD